MPDTPYHKVDDDLDGNYPNRAVHFGLSLLTFFVGGVAGVALGVVSLNFYDSRLDTTGVSKGLVISAAAASVWLASVWLAYRHLPIWGGWSILGGLAGFTGFWVVIGSLLSSYGGN